MLKTQRQHGAQQLVEQRLIARIDVLATRKLGQRQCALGQRLEHQHRRRAASDQIAHDRQGRVRAVARKARSTSDAQRR
ncbi:hypothetical protein SDC9_179812 [bioreactor metagenome]|uniref:Uncharacterized protein n=1 Tax=bioreactor metagenome TaxID=1076179 RepID=A0A645H7S8_9ZZZZ